MKNSFKDGEFLVGGDFNAIKNGRERRGMSDSGNLAEWEEFFDFINNMGLEDLPCKGNKYSLFSSNGRLKTRLDRFLVSSNIVNWWGVVGQQIGDSDISDHCPIWLVANNKD